MRIYKKGLNAIVGTLLLASSLATQADASTNVSCGDILEQITTIDKITELIKEKVVDSDFPKIVRTLAVAFAVELQEERVELVEQYHAQGCR